MGDPSNIDIGWRSALMLAVCMPLLMAALLLLTRQIERRANFWLALLLLAALVAQVPQIIGFANVYAVWPGLTFAPFDVELYIGPLIYLHAYRLMQGGPLGWRKWILVPGLMQTTYYVWAFTMLGDYKAKWAYTGAVHNPYIAPVETVLGVTFIVVAIIAVFRLMQRYNDFLTSTQSAAIEFRPDWLRYLLVAIIGAGIVFASLEITPFFIENVSYVAEFPAQIVMTAIIAWAGFEAIARTNTDFPKMPAQGDSDETIEQPSEIKDWAQEGEILKARVIEGNWYLEPRLSIADLARRMGSNETYISRALNQGLDQSFNVFINTLRVDKAKALISSNTLNMLEIAHEAGFNSKATFNRVFRDMAGMTPSAFKKSQNQ